MSQPPQPFRVLFSHTDILRRSRELARELREALGMPARDQQGDA